MTPDAAWVYAILPFVTMAVLTFGLVVVFRQRASVRRAAGPRQREPSDPPRPWWGNPWLWLAIAAAAVVLGAFVWVGLFSLVLVVIPLVMLQRPRRHREADPSTNGHAHRDAGLFKPE
ncbi:MAG: hypothetical protein ABJB55_09340 [Actinomycetota bacterium]